MMSVNAEGAAGRREERDVGRRSRVVGFSRASGHLPPILVAREIRAVGAGAKRAGR